MATFVTYVGVAGAVSQVVTDTSDSPWTDLNNILFSTDAVYAENEYTGPVGLSAGARILMSALKTPTLGVPFSIPTDMTVTKIGIEIWWYGKNGKSTPTECYLHNGGSQLGNDVEASLPTTLPTPSGSISRYFPGDTWGWTVDAAAIAIINSSTFGVALKTGHSAVYPGAAIPKIDAIRLSIGGTVDEVMNTGTTTDGAEPWWYEDII